MPKAIIKISGTQVIDMYSASTFEKNILQLSYDEYKMKQQAYNTDGSIHTFTALKAKDGRANSLHYKSGFAIAGLVESLNKKISIAQDGREQSFEFDTWRFEVIESDITDVAKHKVAVHYISAECTLFEIIGSYLLLAKGSQWEEGQVAETFLIKIQPGISIVSYQPIVQEGDVNRLYGTRLTSSL